MAQLPRNAALADAPAGAIWSGTDTDGDAIAMLKDGTWMARFADTGWGRAETPEGIVDPDDIIDGFVVADGRWTIHPPKPARVSEPAAQAYATPTGTKLRVLALGGKPKPRIPKNPVAQWQGLDVDGDTVAKVPSGWVMWGGSNWVRCEEPTLPKPLVQCTCIRYGCSRCDIVSEEVCCE